MWMRDGKSVSYSVPNEQWSLAEIDLNGERRRILYSENGSQFFVPAISHDGRTVAARRFRPPNTNDDLVLIQLGSPNSIRVIEQQSGGPCDVSPDGAQIAYISNRTGTSEVWVTPTPNLQHAVQVSFGGGAEPRFCFACPDLFYRKGNRWYAVRKGVGGEWEPPRLVFETEFIDTLGRSYDISPDGTRLLVSKRETPDVVDRIGLVQNWPDLIR
jgi:Tol biopolymer transport system component